MSQGIVRVQHVDGSVFSVDARDHRITVDQPLDSGGTDTGPTPTELFVGAFAACVAHFAVSYLRRHGIVTPLTVTASYALLERPARVGNITVRIEAPDLPAAERPRLLAVARHCTLHNTLAGHPHLDVDFATGEPDIASDLRSA